MKSNMENTFEPKDKPRFYERECDWRRLYGRTLKKRIGNIIDMKTNAKVNEYWATKHNLNTIAESVIFIRKNGIKFVQ